MFAPYLDRHGILHRFSCPYTSEQNGIVERKHRHVVELGLILLAQASLPLKYWTDAFFSATHLINRLPSKSIGGNTPYGMIFHTVPDYHSLKVFGCLCFPHIRPYNNHKLALRSSPCTFLGYSSHHNGYKCLDEHGRIFISRHVIFNDDIFPFVKMVSPSCGSSRMPSSTSLSSISPFYLTSNINHGTLDHSNVQIHPRHSSQ